MADRDSRLGQERLWHCDKLCPPDAYRQAATRDVIRVSGPPARERPLSAAESYGLHVLLDLSRLVVYEPQGVEDGADVVRLKIVGGSDGCDLARGEFGLDVQDGVVILRRGVLRAVADVAGAGVEQRATGHDRHGRVPSADNPLVASERSRDPVVSRAAVALRQTAVNAADRRLFRVVAPWPARARWAVALTHDLDVVRWWPVFTALRVAELTRKGEGRAAVRTLMAAAGSALAMPVARSPVWRATREVLAIEHRRGVPSTWFVIAGTPTLATRRAGDVTYAPESRMAHRVLHALDAYACEIGVHGSFATGTGGTSAFVAERRRLTKAVRESTDGRRPAIDGVRQHYLRMRPGATQRAMVEAGFTYDATYGFPDRNGFRLGVADVAPGWDHAAQRETPLSEVPLVWMDRAQSKYQGIEDPARWVDDALELARACQAVDGLWVGLWHPNLTPALGFPGAPAAYDRLVGALLAEAPFTAALSDIVAWRRLRGAVRARMIAPDGTVILEGPAVRPFEVATEDAAGRAAEALPWALDPPGRGRA